MNSYDDEVMNMLLATYLGKSKTDYVGMQKAYTLRLPVDCYPCVEVLASKDNLSRNDIIVGFVKLGISSFIECMEETNPVAAAELNAEIAKLLDVDVKKAMMDKQND